MEILKDNDVGVSVSFELAFENICIIRRLLNECLNVKNSNWLNENENLFNTCWAYHIGENDSVPEIASRFVSKFKGILNLNVLDALLKGKSDDELREMFAGREEEEKQIIISFVPYSFHFKKKHIKQKLRLVDQSVKFFLDHGIPEEEITIYNQYEGCERGKRYLEILQNM